MSVHCAYGRCHSYDSLPYVADVKEFCRYKADQLTLTKGKIIMRGPDLISWALYKTLRSSREAVMQALKKAGKCILFTRMCNGTLNLRWDRTPSQHIGCSCARSWDEDVTKLSCALTPELCNCEIICGYCFRLLSLWKLMHSSEKVI